MTGMLQTTIIKKFNAGQHAAAWGYVGASIYRWNEEDWKMILPHIPINDILVKRYIRHYFLFENQIENIFFSVKDDALRDKMSERGELIYNTIQALKKEALEQYALNRLSRAC